MNKIFRLFISSTFNDFRKEREILQTKIFPTIKEYALSQDYTFQPIDLRWGVSDEAQLDQKTLELCLNEVRACKTTLYPNFLVMLGDRYGWVPLPYTIEESELTSLLTLMDKKEKEDIQEWYYLDQNQIPASYILKERTDVYKEYDRWVQVENNLRIILQKAVNNSSISSQQKEKYFQSATEAEVQEGILQFKSVTKFQKNVLNEKNDTEHIFGFFRDIDKSTREENKFIEDDYERAQTFKKEVKKELQAENILTTQTSQVDRATLNETYLIEFEKRIVQFLKSQIDIQKAREIKDDLSPLKVELQAQQHFAINQRKNFLSQEELRTTISDYIKNDNQEAFVLYGESGKGKSSLISKAIQECEDSGDSKVIYRFIGATPHSGTTKEVLLSIFSEMGFDLRSQREEQGDTLNSNIIASLMAQESFEEFSDRVYDAFFILKEKITIFIDGVDQFSNKDFFLWLPKKLPKNVKIILSALEDTNYPKDSENFKNLKKRTSNLHQLPDFHQAEKLLDILLAQSSRKIDTFQKKYFLKQYSKVLSPLYIVLAVEKMKHWKSGDKVQYLGGTQRGLVSEFIGNLSKLYHHEKKFVDRVLGFIYSSKDGLSESELLQLLSVDKNFVAAMAPLENSHKNFNNELPLVHWSRLNTQLKPFLNTQMLDGEELIRFTYREFKDVVSAMPNIRKEFKAIVSATQTLILKNQKNSFTDTRWGTLYYKLYMNTPHSKLLSEDLNRTSLWLLNIQDYYWLRKYILYVIDNLSLSFSEDKAREVDFIVIHLAGSTLMDKLGEKDLLKWSMVISTFLTIAIPIFVATGKEQAANTFMEFQSLIQQATGEISVEKNNFSKYLEYNSDIICLEDIYSPIVNKYNEIIPKQQNAANLLISGQDVDAYNLGKEILIELEHFFHSIRDGYTSKHPDFKVFESMGQEKIYEALSKKTDYTADEKIGILLLKEIYYQVYLAWSTSFIDDLDIKEIENFQVVILKLEKEFINNNKLFGNIYIRSLVTISNMYGLVDDSTNATKSLDKALIALEKVNPTTSDYQQLIFQVNNAKMASAALENKMVNAKEYALVANKISKRLYEKHKQKWISQYALNLFGLHQIYFALKDKVNCKKNEELFNELLEEKDHVNMLQQLKEQMTPCSKITKFKVSSLIFTGILLLMIVAGIVFYLDKEEKPTKKVYSSTKVKTPKYTYQNKSTKKIYTNAKVKTPKYKLNIKTEYSAKIRILNIKAKYYSGIKLKPGTYKIEVSKSGYKTKVVNVVIGSKNKLKRIYLTKKKPLYKVSHTKATVKIKIPDNATLNKDGKSWSCNMGYMKIRNGCKRVI